MPVISIEGGRATESDYVIFTLRLSEPSLDAVTVDFATRGGTADRGLDLYNLTTYPQFGTVTFEAGETVRTVAIRVRHDYAPESDESFFLELRNPVGASFGGGNAALSAVGWALDNDAPDDDRALAISDPVVREGAATATFTISLSEAFDTDRTFTYQTLNGTARAGSDYTARGGSVTFLAGQTEATVTVSLGNDGLPEPNEVFRLAVDGAHGVAGAVGTATILDPDARAPVISIEGGTAIEGDFAIFTIRLSEASLDAVTVDFATRGGTADAGLDLQNLTTSPQFGTVTFEAGETVRTVAIRVRHDYGDEIDESFFLELRNPSGAGFGGGNTTLSAVGWAGDDDGAGLNRSVAVSNAELREGPGGRYAVFVVEISSALTEAVTLNYQTANGTARAGGDFAAASGHVTFAAGQTRTEIMVRITDDLVLEGTEQFYLRVAPPFPGVISSRTAAATGTATIHDGTIRGTAGHDVLNGTAAAERIEGFGGNDRINGLAGNDLLVAGAGNDTLVGGIGKDRLLGGSGNDAYFADALDTVLEAAGAGIDRVYAAHSHRLAANVENLTLLGTGNFSATGNGLANVLQGNAGRNLLTGGLGRDTYVIGAGDVVRELAGQGYDTVRSNISYTLGAYVEALALTGARDLRGTGNALANRIFGNDGDNVLRGQAGNDALYGGAGRDTLAGGVGTDRLVGGSAADLLYGGSGADDFVFAAISHSRPGAAHDRIADFAAWVDDLDLRGIDARTGAAGDQSFRFGGTTAAAHSVWYVRQGDNALVRADVNGDGAADFEILLTNVSRLTAQDFLL